MPSSSADTVAKVIGTNQPSNPGLEAELDVQFIMGVAPGAITWFYSLANFNFFSDLSQWLATLNSEATIPQVITVSYGEQGNYPSKSYREKVFFILFIFVPFAEV